MAEVSRLASAYQKAALREWTVFDDLTFKPILTGLVQKVKDEKVDLKELDGFDCEPGMGSRQSRYHCIEAWRNAVLLYCHRVFDRQSDESTPTIISQLAHMVIDHVRWIPENENIRKQLMIPVFMAGAEMRSENSRGFVREYCEQSSQTDSFGQFQYILDVLESIWQRIDIPEDASYWWAHQIEPGSWNEATRGCEVWITEILEEGR